MAAPRKPLSRCAPVFPVDNCVKTATFYEKKLGFETTAARGNPPHYVVVERDGARIHFSEREDTTEKLQPVHAYIYTTDVDSIYEEYVVNGLKMFSPPEDKEHGMREFEVPDCNGHFLTFGQLLK